jgi:hypothetical protein
MVSSFLMPLVKVTAWGYRCLRCEHEWIPRGLDQAPGKRPPDQAEEPRVCPKCKSPYWNRPRKAG